MPATLTFHVDQQGPIISPLLYGVFFEEINRAGEGGLWAEMIQNPSFEDDARTPKSWTVHGPVKATLDTTSPLNPVNPTALRLEFAKPGGRLVHRGFSREKGKDHPADAGGLDLKKKKALRLSLYQRGNAPLQARLMGQNGKLLAKASLPAPDATWRKVETILTPLASDVDGSLVLTGKSSGTIWIDHVSLTPVETWKGHGLRPDLAEKIAAMKPSFVRFPGGCFVEGWNRANALRWKDTIGDPAARRGVQNLWGYRTHGHFGVHEFLQWCEDLDAEPLYVIQCGMGHGYSVPLEEMGEWVQDALDLVEYARGAVDSPWGAKRAANGHPEPFKLNFLQIGNENGGPEYEERYALFYDALKAAYPDLRLIANNWAGGIPRSRPVEIQDDHYYLDAESFMGMADQYAAHNRENPKIYVGEYAVTKKCGAGNLRAALGEAVFMTGLEANGDAVVMASYAPLLVNPAWKAWNPNAIVFDKGRSYGTPSYHTQVLFAANRIDQVCPTYLEQMPLPFPAPKGRFGVGTWATEAEFKNVTFTTLDGQRVFESDFTRGMRDWKPVKGDWKIQDGALRQTGRGNFFSVAEIIGSDWGDGNYQLQARKIDGADGFQIQFQADEEGQQKVWNLGGWGNVQHGLQGIAGEPKQPGAIEAGRWYDVRIELMGPRIRCYLDGQLTQEVVRAVPQRLYAVAGFTRDGRELIVKAVNTGAGAVKTTFNLGALKKVASTAKMTVLTSKDLEDENSFANKSKVVPVESTVTGIGKTFTRSLPARSITVLRLSVTR